MLLLKHRLLQLIVCLLITEKVSVESYNGIFVVTSCRKSKVSFVHYAPSVGVVESQAAINGDHVCCRINVSNVQFLHLPDECNQNDISSSNIGLRVKVFPKIWHWREDRPSLSSSSPATKTKRETSGFLSWWLGLESPEFQPAEPLPQPLPLSNPWKHTSRGHQPTTKSPSSTVKSSSSDLSYLTCEDGGEVAFDENLCQSIAPPPSSSLTTTTSTPNPSVLNPFPFTSWMEENTSPGNQLSGKVELDDKKSSHEGESGRNKNQESISQVGKGKHATSSYASNQGIKFLIPNVSHLINCLPNPPSEFGRNESNFIRSPLPSVTRKGVTKSRNISISLEFEPVMAVTGRTFITIKMPSQKLNLHCKVYGHPTPEIEWFKLQTIPLNSSGDSNETEYMVEWVAINELNQTEPLVFSLSSHPKSCRMKSTLHLVINHEEDLGSYLCSARNVYGSSKSIFIIDATTPKIFSMKGRTFNVNGFVLGMIPPIVAGIFFIMKLGYRSRYASAAVEEEQMEEERLAAEETNNINIFT